MKSINAKQAIFFILFLLSLFLFTSCTAPITTDQKADDQVTTNDPKNSVKPGYNAYGIPGEELWQIMDENGARKDNYKDIIIQIKKKWGIPECITGIPWDDKAKNLLLDGHGNLVNNWEEIVKNLKKEWGVTD